ncbi:F-box/kelch-repeat protein At3g23880-like [Cicer arietinum]|uniref:F-box/kelch-repeat protein At3g23880-like n=1 Tax=Cicer arietinum TaxID=3827 RepID=A0A1S2XMS1_CICAR|nr:F-box/kelch-repeat protein At3g23880-like [Cicer arietinum]XP_027188351.1 F-box/kelch-repeat protein At3g23880-like [Cicer arietinum]
MMNSPTSPVVLFDDLIVEILSFVPVKTLMQLKCVCKSWNTIVSNPSFAKLHLQRSPRNTHLMIYTIDCSAVLFPLSSLPENLLTAIPKYPRYPFLDMCCSDLVGSCNGLICLVGYSRPYEWLRFWNPATNSLSDILGYSYGYRNRLTFGYDSSTDTYKVVSLSGKIVNVFSLGDNVWKNIQNFPVVSFEQCHPCVNAGVHVSGTINWLTIPNMTEYEQKDITIDQFVIVSLDLSTETYRKLLPPQGFVEVPPVEPAVTVLMDCLCFSHRFNGTHFVLWKMMEFGVQESWTQFLKISYQNLHIKSLRNYYDINDWLKHDSELFLFPLCVSESNHTLILACKQPTGFGEIIEHAIVYNWRDNRVEQKIFGDKFMWFCAKDYGESLISTS